MKRTITCLMLGCFILGLGVTSCLKLNPDFEVLTGVVYEIEKGQNIPIEGVFVRACSGLLTGCTTEDTTDTNGLFSIEGKFYRLDNDYFSLYKSGYSFKDSCLRTGGNEYACYMKPEPSFLLINVDSKVNSIDSVSGIVVGGGSFKYDEEFTFARYEVSQNNPPTFQWRGTFSGVQINLREGSNNTFLRLEVEASSNVIYQIKSFLNGQLVSEISENTSIGKSMVEYIDLK